MPKLQKNPPPAYANGSAPLQTAVPYESLPQSTQQPVPVITAVVPSSYNDLPSTNPFSPNFAPQPVPSSAAQPAPAAQIFSPVSPIVETRPVERASQPRSHAPELQRPNANRKSVNLQRLDGKPYPTSNNAEKGPKNVRVAKDMFDGALPPSYKRQSSDPIKPSDVAQATSNTHDCGKCGKKRAEGASCSHCGKRKSSAPEATVAANISNHNRTISSGVVSERSVASSSTAGPSSTAGSSSSQICCTKCGRHKRPGSIGTPHVSATNSTQPGMRLQQAGLSIQPASAGHHNPVYPQIDVIPPSATTYRASTIMSPFTPYRDDSPLVTPQPKKPESKSFRNNSIVRSLSRRLSRKEKEKSPPAPLPSQQLAASENQSGEQSAGRLINMISSAMQEPAGARDHQHSKIGIDESARPSTPFSFVGGRDEADGFETRAVGDRGSVSSQDSFKEVVGGSDKRGEGNGEYFPNQEDRLDVIPRPKSTDPSYGRHLSVSDAESRPQITRFRSLRSGVNRVNNSISRSQSLKRLGSVKSAHHAWYVDGTNENSVPVF